MSGLRSRLAEIERQMCLLDNQMAVLRAERETVARELEAIVYPVLTLPNEILSEIFLQYVGDHLQHNPLLLTWVCRLWRDVAICTHRLWTHFNIGLGSVWLAALWFSRAGTLPLHLHFIALLTPEKSQELLQVVTAYSSQWDTLALDMAVLPAKLCFSFPSLTKLELVKMVGGPSTLPILSDSPRLCELRVELYDLEEPLAAFPCTQLTKLTLDSDLDTCLQLLAQTPNVESLHLSIDSTEQPPASLTPISLPRVRTLELGIETCQVLACITVPALEKLGLYIDDDDPPTMGTELADCITRSGCSIRILELRLVFVSGESLNRFVVSVPLQAVRALTIDGLDFRPGDDVLSQLFIAMTGHSGIFPALETFNIENLRSQDRCRPLFTTLTDDTHKPRTADRAKPFQLFSEAVLEAYDTAKNRELLQMEPKLKKLRQSLSQLGESSQGNNGFSGERIFIWLFLV
ncbi:hypothetical protein FB45DRAFT_1115951 [Roridomyces roridus]|uniref:F-box domain-containing protein n=1 Tax=Roridomyces roridus TaxID=1738132 RepID=A0AAD7CC70_9AGAR|nr:hypothetical protein FB45DRAFT_1115951 [Roridomyces roridus]